MSPATLRRRRWAVASLERHLAPAQLEDATEDLILEWLSTLPAPATRRAVLGDVRLLYRWALRRRVVDHDPTEEIGTVKVPRAVPRPLPHEDLAAVLGACRDAADRRIVLLGLCAGLRAAEMASLHMADVSARAITVRAGKGGGDRQVPTHPTLWAELQHVRGWVLPSPIVGHQHLAASTVSKRMSRLLRSVGLAGSTHRLRHTFATELARLTHGDVCQRPVGSARRRSLVLPSGGQRNCPLVASRSARG
jgi:integrase